MWIQQSLVDFAESTSAKASTPGGGSSAAYMGVLGAALGAMAARYSEGRKGSEEYDDQLAQEIGALDRMRGELLELVDADSDAYAGVTAAYKRPRSTDAEKAERRAAIQEALRDAMEVPLRTCRAAVAGLEVVDALEAHVNPNLASDVSVAATCFGACLRAAWSNVLVNLRSLKDAEAVAAASAEGEKLRAEADRLEQRVVAAVTARLS